MADQKINELPTKTAPSTGDKMLMIGTAEEYQIDYDKLASAILNKLSTQSFSSLDTTSKTVLGAIDELNSKSYSLSGGTVIYSGSDMNADKYKNPGNYYCNNNDVVASLVNSPFTSAFILKVDQATGSEEYPRQTFTRYTDGRIAQRKHDPYNKQWSDFAYFSDDATLFAGKAINSGDDLNDYITPGIYYSENSAITESLLNMPEYFTSGFSLDIKSLNSGGSIQTITYTSASNAGSIIYTRRRSGSLWSNWYKFEGTLISS